MKQPPQRPTRSGTVGVSSPDGVNYLGERPAVARAVPRGAEAVVSSAAPGRASADALADLARAPHSGDPGLTTPAPLACVVPGVIADWCAKGWLPTRRQPCYGQSGGDPGGRFVVCRGDLLAFLATQPERESANRSRATRAWRARRRLERRGAGARPSERGRGGRSW